MYKSEKEKLLSTSFSKPTEKVVISETISDKKNILKPEIQSEQEKSEIQSEQEKSEIQPEQEKSEIQPEQEKSEIQPEQEKSEIETINTVSTEEDDLESLPESEELEPKTTENTETDKTETDKIETDKTETDKIETDKTETDKTETDKTETDKTEIDKTETDKIETDKTETDKTETEYDLVERNEYLKKVKGIPPTCRNLFREEFYYYLPQHVLEKEMEFSLTPNEKIKVELCLYVISNSSTQDPYLAFVLEKKDELFSFPIFEYTYVLPNQKLERKEDEEDSYETIIFNLILNKILSLFEIQMDMKNKKQMKYFLSWRAKSYKGHFFHDTKKTLQVMFDVSYFLPFIKLTKYLLSATLPTETVQWSVLHEIVHLKKLRDIPISSSVTSFFLEEKEALLLNIKNRFGSSTYIPFMMYSCIWQETEFVTSDSTTLSKHPILGSMYFFSNFPLNGSSCPSKRYIVYPTKTIYMIKSLSLELFDTDIFYNSVYFQEKKQPIWGIQNASFFHEL
jgi:hypothetical protein